MTRNYCLLLANYACVLGLSTVSSLVYSHEVTEQGVVPILNIGGRYLDTAYDYPMTRLPNALESSAQQAYVQGAQLEFVDVGLQVAWTSDITTLVKGSYHGTDLGNEFAIEQAWLKYHYDINADHQLTALAGRQHVRLGEQNLVHSHNWQFGVTPLVMRAAIAGGWLDDGVSLAWEHEQGWQAFMGAYQADSFPSVKSQGANAINVGGGWQGHFSHWQLSAAHFNVNGRPTEQQLTQGHSHAQSACLVPTLGQVCFDGQALIVVASGAKRWYGTEFSGEAWWKRETGDLASVSGLVDYQGDISGGWLMASHPLNPTIEASLRLETLAGQHQLTGANAGLIAQEAAIQDSAARLSRYGVGLTWRAPYGMTWRLELHQEDNKQQKNRIFLLRYQWDIASLWPIKP
ncbi:hypothetical protein [Agitococcus lubricus]|uniref:Uncharacterized protein n=1 Tax=Agitococcus lubricus TaxID=1077255 RepID=A0A2T5IZF8_9GAMM|nr:hypothetical protein [Agitococcus lubricus]PTQ89382.1 hypothetical protein C8N29_107115 [Agitococcus lubricus]